MPSVTPNGAAAMSALGHKRTFTHLQPMSALPPKADITEHRRHVCFVPKADIKAPLGGSGGRPTTARKVL